MNPIKNFLHNLFPQNQNSIKELVSSLQDLMVHAEYQKATQLLLDKFTPLSVEKRLTFIRAHIPHHPLTRYYGIGQILDTLLKTSFEAGGAECGYERSKKN